MNKRIPSPPASAPSLAPVFPSANPAGAKAGRGEIPITRKSVESGLLRLCEEVAVNLLKRYFELRDPRGAVRGMRADLRLALRCDEERAGRIVDLALELIHVKIHGRFRRNTLELSQLIARAGNQLRDLSDN